MVVRCMTDQLMCRCEEKDSEVEELKQQLQTKKVGRKITLEHRHCSEDEEQRQSDETKDLQRRLDKEKRRSSNFELQVRFH